MKARLVNFRGGRHTKYNNQMILKVDKIEDRKNADKFLGREVVWKTSTGKEIKGKVSKIHGNKGALLVNFDKGMPGQSINKEVEIK